jgi:antitoxin component of MazEF toxin-antitoxin module
MLALAPVDLRRGEVMTAEEPKTATFETTLTAIGNNTGIVVPDSVVEQLGAGKRPPVAVDVNGYQYRSTVAVMGGQHLVGLSAAVRAATGLAGGDPIRVTLTLATSPRPVEMPPDFAAALDSKDGARQFFDTLPNSLQRYHVDNVNAAKSPDTRRRRIEKSIGLFLEGKRR